MKYRKVLVHYHNANNELYTEDALFHKWVAQNGFPDSVFGLLENQVGNMFFASIDRIQFLDTNEYWKFDGPK